MIYSQPPFYNPNPWGGMPQQYGLPPSQILKEAYKAARYVERQNEVHDKKKEEDKKKKEKEKKLGFSMGERWILTTLFAPAIGIGYLKLMIWVLKDLSIPLQAIPQ